MNTVYVEAESQMKETTGAETAVCLLTLTKKTEIQQRLHFYADYLCHLLNGRIHQIELSKPNNADAYFFEQGEGSKPCDLVVFGEPDRSLVKRLLVRYDKPGFAARLNASLLIAREPSFPIKKILLIVRAQESDGIAVDWVCRLAKNNHIQVTCLPVIPSQPGLYRLGAPTKPRQDVLLAEGTHTGKYVRAFLRQFERENIVCKVTLQPGEPHVQIKQALAESDCDLVVIAAEPYGRIQRLLLGELVDTLLHRVDRPILVAKPVG